MAGRNKQQGRCVDKGSRSVNNECCWFHLLHQEFLRVRAMEQEITPECGVDGWDSNLLSLHRSDILSALQAFFSRLDNTLSHGTHRPRPVALIPFSCCINEDSGMKEGDWETEVIGQFKCKRLLGTQFSTCQGGKEGEGRGGRPPRPSDLSLHYPHFCCSNGCHQAKPGN